MAESPKKYGGYTLEQLKELDRNDAPGPFGFAAYGRREKLLSLAAECVENGELCGRGEQVAIFNQAEDARVFAASRSALPALVEEIERLREALTKIADHECCAYDHPRANAEMYRGPYGIGIVDGHRAAAIIARSALSDTTGEE